MIEALLPILNTRIGLSLTARISILNPFVALSGLPSNAGEPKKMYHSISCAKNCIALEYNVVDYGFIV